MNKMVCLFHRAITNILSNYIPHETIICDRKDPILISNNIKHLTLEKNNTYRSSILSIKMLKL